MCCHIVPHVVKKLHSSSIFLISPFLNRLTSLLLGKGLVLMHSSSTCLPDVFNPKQHHNILQAIFLLSRTWTSVANRPLLNCPGRGRCSNTCWWLLIDLQIGQWHGPVRLVKSHSLKGWTRDSVLVKTYKDENLQPNLRLSCLRRGWH